MEILPRNLLVLMAAIGYVLADTVDDILSEDNGRWVQAGNTVAISCQYIGTGKPMAINSFWDGLLVPGFTTDGTYYLKLKNVSRSDHRNHTCTYKFENGEIRNRTIMVNVAEPMSNASVVDKQALDVDLIQDVVCQFDSFPPEYPLNFTWTLPDGNKISSNISYRHLIIDNRLRILNVSAIDEGNYVCEATRTLPYPVGTSSISGHISVEVKEPPVISVYPDGNGSVTMHCQGTNTTDPSGIRWYCNDTLIANSSVCHGETCVVAVGQMAENSECHCLAQGFNGEVYRSFELKQGTTHGIPEITVPPTGDLTTNGGLRLPSWTLACWFLFISSIVFF